MSLDIGTLMAHVGMDTRELSAGASRANGILKNMERMTSGTAAKLSGVLAGFGVSMGATAAFKAMTASGAEFEHRMLTVGGVMRATKEEFEAVSDAALKMGEHSVFAAQKSADAFYYLASAGFNAKESIVALPGVLDLAKVGVMDLGRAADIAVNVLRGFGLPTEELTRANDVMVGTITRTNAELDQLAETYVYSIPVARNYGYSIEELSGMIGILANSGIRGSMAGTQLAMAMQQANDVALKLGYSGSDLLDVLQSMKKEGRTTADVMEQFGQRAGRAALTLWNNVEATRVLQRTLYGTAGEAKELAETMGSSTESAMRKLSAAVNVIGIQAFDRYKQELKEVIDQTHDWLIAHKQELVAFLAGIGSTFTEVARILSGVGQAIVQVGSTTGIAAGLGSPDTAKWQKVVDDYEKSISRVKIKSDEVFKGRPNVDSWKELLRARATDADATAVQVSAAGDDMRDSVYAPDGQDWESFWRKRQEEAEETTRKYEEAKDRLREALKPPPLTEWQKFEIGARQIFSSIIAVGLGALQAYATVAVTILRVLILSVEKTIEIIGGIGDAIYDLAHGNAKGALNDLVGSLKAAGPQFDDLGRIGKDALDSLAQAGLDMRTSLSQTFAGVKDDGKKAFDFPITTYLSDWEQALGKLNRPGSKAFDFSKPVIPKTISDEDADKAENRLRRSVRAQLDLYDELLASGRLTAGELTAVWAAHLKARQQQIAIEQKDMETIGVPPTIRAKNTALSQKQLGLEKLIGPIAIPSKFRDDAVEMYQQIANAGVLSAAEIDRAWTRYHEKSLEQIDQRAAAMRVEGKAAEDVAAFVKSANAELERQVAAGKRAPGLARVDAEMDPLRNLLNDPSLSTSKRKQVWGWIEEDGKKQIDDLQRQLNDLHVDPVKIDMIIGGENRKLMNEKLEALGTDLQKWAATTGQRMTDALGEFFFDAATNKWEDWHNYVKSLLDDLTRKVSDSAAKWLTDSLGIGNMDLSGLFGFKMDAAGAPSGGVANATTGSMTVNATGPVTVNGKGSAFGMPGADLLGNSGFPHAFGSGSNSAPFTGFGGLPIWGTPGFGFFAEGGIVSRPQLAMIGEAGPEAVIPLGRLRDPAFLDALMSGRRGGGGREGGGVSGNVVFNVQTPGPAAFKHTSAQLMAQAAVALGRRRRV